MTTFFNTRKQVTLLISFMLALTLTACNKNAGEDPWNSLGNPKKPYRTEEAIRNGDVVNLHGKISNLEKFERFLENVQNANQDKIRITMYTIEGDPIFYNLLYKENKIHYTFDNSQDAYGGSDKGQQNTTCSKIDKLTTNKGTEYRLKECSSEVGNTFYFIIP